MRHLKPINRKAKRIETSGSHKDVQGFACSDCGSAFSPGWETDSCGNIDPCPWVGDLPLCHIIMCFWSSGSVPGVNQYPDWLDDCNNYQNDWMNLCVVPD